MPTHSSNKELSFDRRFKTVHNAKVKLWPIGVKWWYIVFLKACIKVEMGCRQYEYDIRDAIECKTTTTTTQ